jgi:nicotinate-nucleotide adenylyltransferase
MKNLGIMGGTFDPIHYGHLLAAEEARFEFNLEKIIFVPSGHPPHKNEKEITPFQHRYLMTSLAISTNPYFEVSSIEIEREGPSYAIDTINIFKNKYPNTNIFFITGADAIRQIITWHKAEELPKVCNFIAVSRPGYKLKEINAELKNKFFFENIFSLEIPGLSISSTEIRNRVKNKKPIKYLLPEVVENYIYQNNLYK